MAKMSVFKQAVQGGRRRQNKRPMMMVGRRGPAPASSDARQSALQRMAGRQ